MKRYGTLDLRCMDCMDLLRNTPDNAYDLAIVDPPYGIGNFNQSDSKYNKVSWNEDIPNSEYFDQLSRVSKEYIIWGANYYNCFTRGGGAIVWYKENPHPNLSDCEIASRSFGKKVDYVKISHQKTILIENGINRIHPCQKPVALYRWLLQNYAKAGDKILDTHLGSGSIAIACYYMGFDLTGCELDSDYYTSMMLRVKRETHSKCIPKQPEIEPPPQGGLLF